MHYHNTFRWFQAPEVTKYQRCMIVQRARDAVGGEWVSESVAVAQVRGTTLCLLARRWAEMVPQDTPDTRRPLSRGLPGSLGAASHRVRAAELVSNDAGESLLQCLITCINWLRTALWPSAGWPCELISREIKAWPTLLSTACSYAVQSPVHVRRLLR